MAEFRIISFRHISVFLSDVSICVYFRDVSNVNSMEVNQEYGGK